MVRVWIRFKPEKQQQGQVSHCWAGWKELHNKKKVQAKELLNTIYKVGLCDVVYGIGSIPRSGDPFYYVKYYIQSNQSNSLDDLD